MKQYSDRQLQAAELLSELGAEKAQEIIALIGEAEHKTASPSLRSREEEEAQIRLQIINEVDWRKKAQLAALLISRSLE